MSRVITCFHCGATREEQDLDIFSFDQEDSDFPAEVRVKLLGRAQDISDEANCRDEGDLSCSERERVRMMRWMDIDEAEPPSIPYRPKFDSPPYHQPQAGLLWNDKFVRTPPKSLWEPSCSEGEEPDLYVFPFKIFPKIAPEDDKRCSPVVSEYWSDQCGTPYSHNGMFVFPPPRALTWTPSEQIIRALGTD